jgi:hypothetical protein
MAKLTSDPIMQALHEAGIADDNTSRVVIDVRHGHIPVVHIERFGDEKLLDVVTALGGVQITREEAPPPEACELGCKVCFPDPYAKCPHHGLHECRFCHANPGDCRGDTSQVGCGFWSATGMHWDTCPNRRS